MKYKWKQKVQKQGAMTFTKQKKSVRSSVFWPSVWTSQESQSRPPGVVCPENASSTRAESVRSIIITRPEGDDKGGEIIIVGRPLLSFSNCKNEFFIVCWSLVILDGRSFDIVALISWLRKTSPAQDSSVFIQDTLASFLHNRRTYCPNYLQFIWHVRHHSSALVRQQKGISVLKAVICNEASCSSL